MSIDKESTVIALKSVAHKLVPDFLQNVIIRIFSYKDMIKAMFFLTAVKNVWITLVSINDAI
jgi:hypothetical protein